MHHFQTRCTFDPMDGIVNDSSLNLQQLVLHMMRMNCPTRSPLSHGHQRMTCQPIRQMLRAIGVQRVNCCKTRTSWKHTFSLLLNKWKFPHLFASRRVAFSLSRWNCKGRLQNWRKNSKNWRKSSRWNGIFREIWKAGFGPMTHNSHVFSSGQ